MRYFSMLIKPASSTCNLRCRYCFYADIADKREERNFGVMSEEVTDGLLDNVFSSLTDETTITFAFQGGEPTCAGLGYFERFIEKVQEKRSSHHHVRYTIQTNATLLDEGWFDLFKRNDFLVGVSLDGYQSNNDSVRVDAEGNGTYKRIMDNIRRMEALGITYNILTVLTPSLASSPEKLYSFYKKNKLRFIQLIPCLAPLGEKGRYALDPRSFFRFYDEFFALWYKDWKKGSCPSVAYFDNIIPMFRGIPAAQCGYLGRCSMQYVVEADGSVYPCDFYCIDSYKVGNIMTDSLQKLFESSVTRAFINEKKEPCSLCASCRYESICHGQCKRLAPCYHDDSYCAQQAFLRKNEKQLLEVASTL